MVLFWIGVSMILFIFFCERFVVFVLGFVRFLFGGFFGLLLLRGFLFIWVVVLLLFGIFESVVCFCINWFFVINRRIGVNVYLMEIWFRKLCG